MSLHNPWMSWYENFKGKHIPERKQPCFSFFGLKFERDKNNRGQVVKSKNIRKGSGQIPFTRRLDEIDEWKFMSKY